MTSKVQTTWTCDACGRTEVFPGHGKPMGWGCVAVSHAAGPDPDWDSTTWHRRQVCSDCLLAIDGNLHLTDVRRLTDLAGDLWFHLRWLTDLLHDKRYAPDGPCAGCFDALMAYEDFQGWDEADISARLTDGRQTPNPEATP